MSSMELGVLYDFRNPPDSGISDADLYAATLDHIEACEELGFDVVWLTEHHFIADGYLPSVLTMAAAVAQRTTRATIGTAVLLAPLHDPLRIAEDAAVVDLLSGGRLRLGLGLGYKLEEFEAFGVDRRIRGALLDEIVAVLRDAWSPGPVTFEGTHLRYEGVDVTPKPVQQPPPIWLAGRADRPVRRAASIGDGLIAVGGPDLFARYLEARHDEGRTGPVNLCTFFLTYPTDDPERAEADLGRFIAYRADNYAEWYGAAGDLDTDLVWRDLARRGRPIGPPPFSTVDDTVALLDDLAAAGVTSVLWFATLPGTRPEATLPFFETVAREVRPRLAGGG